MQLSLGILTAFVLAATPLWSPLLRTNVVSETVQFFDVVDNAHAPTLSVALKSSEETLQLTLETTNFEFAEVCTGNEPILTGHAHVYVNGIKRLTAYTPSVNLPPLSAGNHTITVTLQASEHRFIRIRGAEDRIVKHTQTVDVL
jgi:hypothetical protein